MKRLAKEGGEEAFAAMRRIERRTQCVRGTGVGACRLGIMCTGGRGQTRAVSRESEQSQKSGASGRICTFVKLHLPQKPLRTWGLGLQMEGFITGCFLTCTRLVRSAEASSPERRPRAADGRESGNELAIFAREIVGLSKS